MARSRRIVGVDHPHHITQRGNRRQKTFLRRHDYRTYLDYLSAAKENANVDIWAYCLMPNHVHFVCVPRQSDSLARLFRDAHRRYTCHINKREGWTGHLWQGRFYSTVLDEPHLLAAARYVELNPVEAGLCRTAQEWPWSSVHAHLAAEDDRLVDVQPMLDLVGDWRKYLKSASPTYMVEAIRRHTKSGKILGCEDFASKVLGEQKR